MDLYKLQNVNFKYVHSQELALEKINFSFNRGEFILFIGPSGSGKSTLLNLINGMVPFFYNGELSGQVLYQGQVLNRMPSNVGTVFQNSEQQLLHGKVLDELVFGLENSGLTSWEMKKRIGELISFLGIEDLLGKETEQLSGGEKQLICIASVLAMRPEVLILDEPTSQLDPAAADSILGLIKKINLDLGTAVLISEQRIDKCYNYADQIVYLEKGRILYTASPQDMVVWQINNRKQYLPVISKFFNLHSLGTPVTVKEAKAIVEKMDFNLSESDHLIRIKKNLNDVLLSLKKVSYFYHKNNQALKNIDLQIEKGEFIVLSGANGAGKTTLLKVLGGIYLPSKGKIEFKGKKIKKNTSFESGNIGYLPQNLGHYLFNRTVQEELYFNANNLGEQSDLETKVEQIIKWLGLQGILNSNPRELSIGQQQKVAIASLLVCEPELLLLDEPTKGLDLETKKELGRILNFLISKGTTVIIVTHDLEFIANYGQRMLIMFQGEIVADGLIKEILQDNWFYTTQMNLVFRDKIKGIINYSDACRVLEDKNEKR